MKRGMRERDRKEKRKRDRERAVGMRRDGGRVEGARLVAKRGA